MKKLICVLLLLLAVILTLSACDLDDSKVTTTTTTTTTKTGTTTAPADPVDPSDPSDPTDPSDHSKHTSSTWIVDKKATCTEEGSKHKECTVCHETLETATIKTTGHNYKNGKCAECGKEQVDSEGLEFTLGDYGYYDDYGNYKIVSCYSVTGIGTCTDTDIIIPSKYNGLPVKEIGEDAFKNCTELTSVTIPDSVVWIGSTSGYSSDGGVFGRCTKLKSVTIGNSVKYITPYTFSGCSGLESITVDEGNTVYHSTDNCLIETSTNRLVLGCKNSIIPNYVTYIDKGAFKGCKKLTSIAIPDSVAYIGDLAFNDCSSLKSVTIPDSVEHIGNHVFSGCDSLKYNEYDNALYLGNADNPYLVLIKANEYYTLFGYNYITSCIINENTTIICNWAFSNCEKLTSVTIGNSVEYIGEYAFHGCTKLKTINYTGTEEQWEAIFKVSDWDENTGNYTINYNYKGN